MDNFTVSTCVAFCVLTSTIYTIFMWIRRHRNFYELAAQYRGPPCLPIIGNAHLFLGDTEDIMKRIGEIVKSYPPPLRLWVANRLLIGVDDPEHIKVVCLSSKTIDRGEIYDFAKPWLGTGLLTASAEKWRVHRKLINPTFHTEILTSFIEVFATQAAKTARAMEDRLNGSEFDVNQYLAEYSLTNICKTTMGVNLESTKKHGLHQYAEAAESTMAGMIQRSLSPWLYPDFIFSRTRLGKEQQKHIEFFHNFTDNVIKMKRKEFENRNGSQLTSADNENHDSVSIPRRKVFLDLLLQLSVDDAALSDEALREEVHTMIATGSDTTAAVSSYMMLLLASHPEVQEKVYEELCEIYGDHRSDKLTITRENLNRMTYMDRVIKETMRVFPIVPYIARRVKDDLNLGEYTLPKGSEVVLAIFDVHRNDKYWPDPLKFDPDRFLPEEVAKRDPYTYMAFSNGPRSCIGSKYGMLSLKTLMATILWKFVLKKDNVVPIKDIRLKMEFVLRTVDPITLRIERRKCADASN